MPIHPVSADQSPLELLSHLVRFDTSNPPGGEAGCIAFLEELLCAAGLETTIVARDPVRPNLVARLHGRGQAPPLLLNGHVDVVPAAGQSWTHPPFAGEIQGGFLWGRGTLDDKAGVAMMVTALLRARAENLEPAGDIVFMALADEERGSRAGAEYLVREHAHLFADVRFALGEFGGFTLWQGGRRLYPLQIAEKQSCRVRAVFRGREGHSAARVENAALPRLGRALQILDRGRLPVHITEPVSLMIRETAKALPVPLGSLLELTLRPGLTDRILRVNSHLREALDPLFHNTATPVAVSGEGKTGMVPGQAELEIDARLLPGMGSADLERELRALLGDGVRLEFAAFDPAPSAVDMALFGLLKDVLQELDPAGHPVPLVLPGSTDARFFRRLGIQSYGFNPISLPRGFEFWRLMHAADERVPVDALDFGAEAIYRVLQRYGGTYPIPSPCLMR